MNIGKHKKGDKSTKNNPLKFCNKHNKSNKMQRIGMNVHIPNKQIPKNKRPL